MMILLLLLELRLSMRPPPAEFRTHDGVAAAVGGAAAAVNGQTQAARAL